MSGSEFLYAMNGRRLALLPAKTITTALTGDTSGLGAAAGTAGLGGIKHVVAQAKFVYGSGGTNATAYIQTSLDNGATWIDVISFQFTTASANKASAITVGQAPASQAFAPTDGALTANTVIQGVLGDRLRVKVTTTGVYGGGTTLAVDCWVKG